jgi:amino acid transporter
MEIINIGSPVVLGIILSMFNSTLLASYGIVISCLLLRRLRGLKMPDGKYSLRWGSLINALALLYILPYFVFSFFPGAPNPTALTMNYAIVMIGGIMTLATVYYIIRGHNTYQPPTETTEELREREEEDGAEVKEDSVTTKELDV